MTQSQVRNHSDEPRLPTLSSKEALVLELLASRAKELYGLEMIELADGRLKRGTIYVTLQRLQEKGFIDSRQEARTPPEIGIPRRLYSITGFGQTVIAAYEAAHSVWSSAFTPVLN